MKGACTTDGTTCTGRRVQRAGRVSAAGAAMSGMIDTLQGGAKATLLYPGSALRGADPNSDRYGSTPLHRAAQYTENPAVIQALLDAGADPAAKDSFGNFPWDSVERDELKGHEAYWRLLEGQF